MNFLWILPAVILGLEPTNSIPSLAPALTLQTRLCVPILYIVFDFILTSHHKSVFYGTGNFSGKEYLDTVTLGSLSITQQSIGVASKAEGFRGVDGILGIGPVNRTKGTVSNMDTVPTLMDNLFSQRSINSEVLGVYFVPASVEDATGTLTFGGYESSLNTSDISYTSTTSASPANSYWGIDQSITYGSTSLLSLASGIVDTGTVLILIASGKLISLVPHANILNPYQRLSKLTNP